MVLSKIRFSFKFLLKSGLNALLFLDIAMRRVDITAAQRRKQNIFWFFLTLSLIYLKVSLAYNFCNVLIKFA